MREQFPHKKKGDGLSAGHVNGLSAVAGRFGRLTNGGFLNIQHGQDTLSINAFPPWQQYTLIIYATKIDDDDDDDSGLYRVRMRYYDHEAERWKTDDNSNYELDGTEFNLTGLATDDKVTGYWNAQRGMFVPITNAVSGRMIHGILMGSITSLSLAMEINTVAAIAGNSPVDDDGDSVTVENSHKWAADSGALVKAVWCNEDEQWEAWQIDCPVP